MTFWNRLRLVGTVIVLLIAMLVLLDDLLSIHASGSADAKPVPHAPQPPARARPLRGTSGL